MARQGQAVTVDAAALDPDHDIAWYQPLTSDDPIERHDADRHADQIETSDHLLELGYHAARDLDPGLSGALGKPLCDGAEDFGIGFLDRDVIDHRHRPCADADRVVDVHRHTIDPDRVIAVHHLRDDRL